MARELCRDPLRPLLAVALGTPKPNPVAAAPHLGDHGRPPLLGIDVAEVRLGLGLGLGLGMGLGLGLGLRLGLGLGLGLG